MTDTHYTSVTDGIRVIYMANLSSRISSDEAPADPYRQDTESAGRM